MAGPHQLARLAMTTSVHKVGVLQKRGLVRYDVATLVELHANGQRVRMGHTFDAMHHYCHGSLDAAVITRSAGLRAEFAATTIRALNFQGFKDSPDMEAVSNFQGKLWVTPKCIAMRKKWPDEWRIWSELEEHPEVTCSAHRSSMGVRLSGNVIARR
jgi:hypothetical protein